MSVNSREELKMFALRALGYPLVEIDITDEAANDKIDEALEFFAEYYFDGVDRAFYKHQVTQQDIDNRYILIPPNIWGVTAVFPFSNSANVQPNIFDLEYQLRQNDLRDITSTSLIYYQQVMNHLALIDQTLTVQRQFRFNRNSDKLYIDMNWINRVTVGSYLLIDCYSVLDPDENPKMWNNRLLKKYLIALFKMQWSTAYSKFDNITLPGGVTIDGKAMYADAKAEVDDIEADIINNGAPINFLVG